MEQLIKGKLAATSVFEPHDLCWLIPTDQNSHGDEWNVVKILVIVDVNPTRVSFFGREPGLFFVIFLVITLSPVTTNCSILESFMR